MKRKIWFIGLATLAFNLTFFAVCKNYSTPRNIIRCNSYANYDFGDFRISANQELRVNLHGPGYIYFNGLVYKGNDRYVLSRKINLTAPVRLDKDTFTFTLGDAVTLPSDNADAFYFGRILGELLIDNHTVQLDLSRLSRDTVLVGGPVSYLFTCVTY